MHLIEQDLLKYENLRTAKGQPFFSVLSSSELVNKNGGDLTQTESEKLCEFLDQLIGSQNSTIIARGESDENLKNQYNFDTENPELLAECIFMAGEKGRMCWNEKKFIDPDDTSSDNFRSICETLKKYIKEECKGDTKKAKKMRVFYLRNKQFCDAFNSIDSLVCKYEKLLDNDKKMVNLYYLSIVHTIDNSSEYKEVSNFVSTSTNFSVAKNFSNYATIYGWVPRRPMRKGIKSIDFVVIKYGSNVKKLKMPSCETPAFPKQKEIALRCGILPHFIIGFNIGQKFYVNPAIFNSPNDREMDDIVCNGLIIDQTDFEEFCNKYTKFKRYYTFDGNKYEMHVLKNN